MRIRHSARTTSRPEAALGALRASLCGVVVVLAGLGFLLAPAAPASAQPPPQGWTTTGAPLPSDAGNGTTDPQVYLASSTCPAANACTMVGWYFDDASPQQSWGLIEQQNGTSWTDTEAPQPPNHGSGTNQGLWLGSSFCGYDQPCRAVSCPTTTFCVAVGQYTDTAGFGQPVIETETNGTWSATEGPTPSDVADESGSPTVNGILFSVSCASATSCEAVGMYRNTSGDYLAYISTLAGTTWSATTAPVPSGAVPSTSQFPMPLSAVSCPTTSFCVASGVYRDSDDKLTGLLDTLSNGSWSATPAPQPSDAGNDASDTQNTVLGGVVCPSPSACDAVGSYTDTNGHNHALIDTLNGSTWTATSGPEPAGTTFSQLGAISCPTANFCVAVGQAEDTNNHEWGLINTFSSGSWAGGYAPEPVGVPETNQYAFLWEVSCPTPGSCLVPGEYENSSGYYLAEALTLSGGSWSAIDAPLPSDQSSTHDSYGRTVACYSPVACVLGGQYHNAANHTLGFLDTWTGAQGYWLDATDGGIFTYPNNTFYGSTGSIKLNKPMVGMDPTPDGQGYWLVASDGGIFTYGDAQFHGSRGGQPLNKPIVGMATTPDGQGYWLVASDGGIFTYGDANYYGSRGGQPINAPIVGMAATPDGGGYWLVGSDGGIYSYGDALFYGSAGALKLNKPVVGMAASPSGLGYWLVASDGGVFNYGASNFYGSTGSIRLNKPVVGMASSPSGLGYWLVASDGGIFNYGDAPFEGSAGSLHLNAPVVGMAGG